MTKQHEHPILFSAPMVRAIIDGRKAQTRRVMKPQPEYRSPPACVDGVPWLWKNVWFSHGKPQGKWPYKSGDRLWVRESIYVDLIDFDYKRPPKDRDMLYYRADGECCQQIPECSCAEVGKPKWRPSIHMPRWASRLTLEVTDVRVQRVQEIGHQDAMAEGCAGCADTSLLPVEDFKGLWDSINAKRGYGWSENPWVWAITFRMIES